MKPTLFSKSEPIDNLCRYRVQRIIIGVEKWSLLLLWKLSSVRVSLMVYVSLLYKLQCRASPPLTYAWVYNAEVPENYSNQERPRSFKRSIHRSSGFS